MSDLQRYPLNLCLSRISQYSYLYSDKKHKTALVYTNTEYSVHCNLESQSSAIQVRLSTSSLSGQRFKGYRCETDMLIYNRKVTWNYAYSLFKRERVLTCNSNFKLIIGSISLLHNFFQILHTLFNLINRTNLVDNIELTLWLTGLNKRIKMRKLPDQPD